MQYPNDFSSGRYQSAKGIEGEFEPGSHRRVLANKLGIISKKVMDQLEFEALVQAQEKYLSKVTTETTFSSDMICTMHRNWLGKIYPWAGDYRSVELSKGNFTWPPARFVAQNMKTVERQTFQRWTPCRQGPPHIVAEALAHVQSDILLVHPFREGNGRIARWVTDLMSMQAGFPILDYAFRGRGSLQRREDYLDAVRYSYSGNYRHLARFLLDAMKRAVKRAGR